MNRARNADHAARTCERFVYFIVKITSVWLSNMADTLLKNSRGAQRYVGFFLGCAFRMLIGWGGKLRSHGICWSILLFTWFGWRAFLGDACPPECCNFSFKIRIRSCKTATHSCDGMCRTFPDSILKLWRDFVQVLPEWGFAKYRLLRVVWGVVGGWVVL